MEITTYFGITIEKSFCLDLRNEEYETPNVQTIFIQN